MSSGHYSIRQFREGTVTTMHVSTCNILETTKLLNFTCPNQLSLNTITNRDENVHLGIRFN